MLKKIAGNEGQNKFQERTLNLRNSNVEVIVTQIYTH